jgi:PAS domain S-box-containing protein
MIYRFISCYGTIPTVLLVTLVSCGSSLAFYLCIAGFIGKISLFGGFLSILLPAMVASAVSVPIFQLIAKLEQAKKEIEYHRDKLESLVVERTLALKKSNEKFVSEIEERKRVEKELREREEKYRMLADNASDVIASSDLSGRFLYISPSVERFLGYTSQEAETIGLAGLLTPDSYALAMDTLNKWLDMEKKDPLHGIPLVKLELEYIHRGGSVLWCEVTARFLRDTQGLPCGVISVTRDITDRKAATTALKKAHDNLERGVQERTLELFSANQKLSEEIIERKLFESKLRESEERFRNLAELLPETVFEADLEGKLDFINQQAFEQFGYSKMDFEPGFILFDLLADEDCQKYRECLRKVIDGKKVGIAEINALRKDGSTFPALLYLTAIVRTEDLIGVRGLMVDITDLKQIEVSLRKAYDDLKKTQAQLIQSGKLASIGELSAGVAHELNQPLLVIRGAIQLMKKAFLNGEFESLGTLDNFDLIERNTKRMMNIFSHLRIFSRQSSSAIPATAYITNIRQKFLILFLRQKKKKKGQGWGFRSATASSRITAGRSTLSPPDRRERVFALPCPPCLGDNSLMR